MDHILKKKNIIYIIFTLVLIYLFTNINCVEAKDLWYEGLITDDGRLQYTTHVKSSKKYETDNQNVSILRTRTGPSGSYLTQYLSFHFNYGSNYYEEDNVVYYHDTSNRNFVNTSEQYAQHANGQAIGLEAIAGMNADNYVSSGYMNQLWGSWYEHNEPKYKDKIGESKQIAEKVEKASDGKYYANATFEVPSGSFNVMKENMGLGMNPNYEMQLKSSLGVSDKKGTYYIRLSHFLITKYDGQKLMRTSSDFYTTRTDWDIANFGKNEKGRVC